MVTVRERRSAGGLPAELLAEEVAVSGIGCQAAAFELGERGAWLRPMDRDRYSQAVRKVAVLAVAVIS